MSGKHPNEGVSIVVLPSASGKAYAAAERRKIQQLVKKELLLTSMEPYHKAQVEVRMAADGAAKELLVSLLRVHTYTADVVRVTVSADYKVTSIARESPDA
jgi:hypothetical protein